MKGAAGNCGAVALQNAAMEVDKAAARGDLRPIGAKFSTLQEEFSRLKSLLES